MRTSSDPGDRFSLGTITAQMQEEEEGEDRSRTILSTHSDYLSGTFDLTGRNRGHGWGKC